jgi:tRNA nucleotidyltransferase (CCA-adding enzyme)
MDISILESLPLPRNVKNEIISLHGISKNLGYGTYIVGGVLRDYIIEYPIKGIDIVIDGDATRVARIYSDKLRMDK